MSTTIVQEIQEKEDALNNQWMYLLDMIRDVNHDESTSNEVRSNILDRLSTLTEELFEEVIEIQRVILRPHFDELGH